MTSLKGRTWGEIYGPERARQLRELKSQQRTGKTPEEIWGLEVGTQIREGRRERRLGKTYDEIYGTERAEEEREKRTRPLSRDSARVRVWSDTVRQRDDYTCQECRFRDISGGTVAHHIESWDDAPDLRLEVENGVTLCRSCHLKRHRS